MNVDFFLVIGVVFLYCRSHDDDTLKD